jgi:hypothetical protein
LDFYPAGFVEYCAEVLQGPYPDESINRKFYENNMFDTFVGAEYVTLFSSERVPYIEQRILNYVKRMPRAYLDTSIFIRVMKYVKKFIGRWSELEQAIEKELLSSGGSFVDIGFVILYAEIVMQQRWINIEKYITTSYYKKYYSVYVMKKKLELGLEDDVYFSTPIIYHKESIDDLYIKYLKLPLNIY